MVHFRETRAVGVVAWAVVLGLVGQTALGRDVKLVVRPQKLSAEAGKYVLLPPVASLTDGDAVPWYEKAVKALPGKASDDRIREWLSMPIDQLPFEQVEQVLTRHMESLRSAAKAAKCRQCNWPEPTPGMEIPNLTEYRRLAFVVRLWARLEIAGDGYEGAILALQTGFGMARHMAQAPSAIQFLNGVSVAAGMCGEIEQWVQMDDAPNLYAAFAALPKPFIDAEKCIENEKKALPSELPAGLTREQVESQLKASYDRLRGLAKRFSGDLALWQCVEAIRSYTASHGGQLPETLAEITEVSVPKDSMTGEAFRYTRTGATAVLESPTAPGNKEKVIRYEITLKN